MVSWTGGTYSGGGPITGRHTPCLPSRQPGAEAGQMFLGVRSQWVSSGAHPLVDPGEIGRLAMEELVMALLPVRCR